MTTIGSLYNKYRPKTIGEMIGNDGVRQSVINLLKDDKKGIPNAWLFHGPSGIGKTTIARCIAEYLDGKEGINIFEINAGTVGKLDDMRELVERLHLKPFNSKTAIYIIDEAHQLTAGSQNALLKPMEDAPAGIFFILCTTEIEKILKTIMTRVTAFKLNACSPDELLKLVKSVCRREEIDYKNDDMLQLLEAIAERADGSPRLALNLLEKCLGVDDDEQIAEILAEVPIIAGEAMGERIYSAKLINMMMKPKRYLKIRDFVNAVMKDKTIDWKQFRIGIAYQLSYALQKCDTAKQFRYFSEACLLAEKSNNEFYTKSSVLPMVIQCYRLLQLGLKEGNE